MKNVILTLCSVLMSAGIIIAQGTQRKIQVAILFDTSNSMDGLIEQAKSRIWNIVNDLGALRYEGQIPTVEIGLYEYGNDNIRNNNVYIRQLLPLSTDLDAISEKLFGLSTNGGSEYCGAVIGRSISDMPWSDAAEDLKMIYIAGNEMFDQGPVNYKTAIAEARKKNVYINTIYCGSYEAGVRELWLQGAETGKGEYFNIDSDREVVYIKTPYDDQINQYNDSLNQTYYGFGSLGREKKEAQIHQDANASSKSSSNQAERTIAKGSAVYKNSSWDLIDAVEEGNADISTLKDDDLPEELKGKSEEEIKVFLEEKKEDRLRYQQNISKLATERENFISEERKKNTENSEVDDLGGKITQSIEVKAKELKFEKVAKGSN